MDSFVFLFLLYYKALCLQGYPQTCLVAEDDFNLLNPLPVISQC